MGRDVDIVETGIGALESLRDGSYDVVLMDVQMPEMDGPEAPRRIREEWAKGEQPRVIALAAAATGEDRERCRAAGMDGFLSKPLQQDDLADALAQEAL
jgi:CheY-like chemotaxis protein